MFEKLHPPAPVRVCPCPSVPVCVRLCPSVSVLSFGNNCHLQTTIIVDSSRTDAFQTHCGACQNGATTINCLQYLLRSLLNKMKRETIANILVQILWLFWLTASIGKKYAPEIFGTSAVQWTCTIIVVVLIPVVALLALRMIFCGSNRKYRRSGFGYFLAAFIPLLYALTTYGVFGPTLVRVRYSFADTNERHPEIIAMLTEFALSEP